VVEVDGNFRANNYFIDRHLQKAESFTGIRGALNGPRSVPGKS
jgi:hypothetical protein